MQVLSLALKNNEKMKFLLEEALRFGSKLLISFRLHLLFFFMLSIYYVTLASVESFYDIPPRGTGILGGLFSWLETLLYFITAWVLISRSIHLVFYAKYDDAIAYFINDCVEYTQKLLLNILPILFVTYFFSMGFSLLKSTITFIHPFSYDLSLMQLDRWLHFGNDPWQLLHPVLGHYWVTLFLNYVYNFWFFVVAFVTIKLGFSGPDNKLRMQFFTANFLAWFIGGFIFATFFSSAGPAFYGNLDIGDNPYAGLMIYLNEVNAYMPVWALQGQEMVWNNFLNNNAMPAASISAMPSMHNTVAALIALTIWRFGWKFRIFAISFVISIFLGSIHLGWHYAVDGYFGFLIAITCWWSAGHITNWYMALPPVKEDLKALAQN